MIGKKLYNYACCCSCFLLLVSSAHSERLTTAADATYVVKKGDTLWDIAFTFLGDPFQWPQIWNINPSISNPHLIYPGDSIIIRDQAQTDITETQTVATEVVETVLPVSISSPIIEQVALTDSLQDDFEDDDFDSSFFQSILRKNPFDKSFYAKIPFLWTDKDPSGNIYPGKGIVNKPENASYKLFDKIVIKPQTKDYFSVGDTLDIYQSVRFVEYDNSVANIVMRVGKCRVLESEPKKVIAELFEQWEVVRGSERVDKAISFDAAYIDTLIMPSIAIAGTIFTKVEESPSPYPYQTMILNKGSLDGVEIGDVFGLYHAYGKNNAEKLSAVGIVCHVNEKSSSIVLITMIENIVMAGDKAILVRKIRFSNKESK